MAGSIKRGRDVRLAVVGLGGRSTGLLKTLLGIDAGVGVPLVVDVDPDGAQKRLNELGLADKAEILADVEALIDRADEVDGVIVGTRCNLHTPIACQLAKTNLPLFLEKPVAVDWRQLDELAAAFAGRGDDVVVSFPLRHTLHMRTALEILASGRLGTINQIQAINNVPYGGVYYAKPYREYALTGGLWLQKATHDFDYIHLLMASQPETVVAMHSRRIYGGTLAQDQHCRQCDLTATCAESPQSIAIRGDDGGVGTEDHSCLFSEQIKNQDAGAAIVMYANGAHASYAQNFVTRRSAGRRGATVIGYEGTLSFDWYGNEVTVVDHHRNRVDRISVEAMGGHGGGDAVLLMNFLDVVRGRAKSTTPLDTGLLSVSTCLAVRDAANKKTAEKVRPVTPMQIARRDREPAIKGCAAVEPATV